MISARDHSQSPTDSQRLSDSLERVSGLEIELIKDVLFDRDRKKTDQFSICDREISADTIN